MTRASSLARRLVRRFASLGLTISTAESCTGGLISKLLTDVPGSSSVLLGGCVSYTNEVKIRVLGVSPSIIETETEVSAACAKAMAEGARRLFGTDVALSTTGYAGPTGGTDRDPVGTVYIGIATASGTSCVRLSAPPGSSRSAVRTLAAERALEEGEGKAAGLCPAPCLGAF